MDLDKLAAANAKRQRDTNEPPPPNAPPAKLLRTMSMLDIQQPPEIPPTEALTPPPPTEGPPSPGTVYSIQHNDSGVVGLFYEVNASERQFEVTITKTEAAHYTSYHARTKLISVAN